MTPSERKKLEKALKSLEEAQHVILEMLAKSESTKVGSATITDFNSEDFLASLKKLDRTTAEKELQELKQNHLGSVFVETGGSSTDRQKPKVWLIEQILWRTFDFERGHEAIRGRGD